jgi:plastocyanin
MNGNQKLFSVIGRFPIVGLFVGILLTAGFAVTHIVQFGGSFGFAYSPNSLSVKVGDTIKWEGSFTTHPLSSTTIPSQAASWQNASGTTFIYVVKAPGTYNYQCDVHFSSGMTGSFTATSSTGVVEPNSIMKRFDFQIINTQGANIVAFSLPEAAQVKVTLFTALGKEITLKADGFLPAGSHEIALEPMAKGYYVVKVTAGALSEVKVLRILQ